MALRLSGAVLGQRTGPGRHGRGVGILFDLVEHGAAFLRGLESGAARVERIENGEQQNRHGDGENGVLEWRHKPGQKALFLQDQAILFSPDSFA